ncbi:MAG TPA: hypothetical protein VFI52_17445, partial [Gemmatimonadaceae bacterium]|nr:hypothetical protein [Gemmatimonadaceae bacterium]
MTYSAPPIGSCATFAVALTMLGVIAWPGVAQQAATTQNPSPMSETTRAHQRLVQKPLRGTVRSFVGPAGKPAELLVPAHATSRGVVDLVVHFHGAAWLPEQAV